MLSFQIAKVAKTFRVYYKAGQPSRGAPNDYIVDHSIMVYLMDPDGNFADYYGKPNSLRATFFSMLK